MALAEAGKIDYFSDKILFWEFPNFSFLPRRKGDRIYSPLFCFSPKKSNKAFKKHAYQFEPLANHVGLVLSSAQSPDHSEENIKLGIVNSEYEDLANFSGEWIEDECNSGHFRVRSIIKRRKLIDVSKSDQGIYIRVFVEGNSNDSLVERSNGSEPLNVEKWLQTDWTIKVKGQEFNVHKTVLLVRCKNFAELLLNDPNIISEYNPKAFEKFLNFIYTDKIHCTSPSILCELYYLAEKYVIEDLKQKCINVLKSFLSVKDLSVEKFFDIMNLFIKYKESELQEHITEFIALNWNEVINTDQWLLIMRDYTLEARDLLNDTFKLLH